MWMLMFTDRLGPNGDRGPRSERPFRLFTRVAGPLPPSFSFPTLLRVGSVYSSLCPSVCVSACQQYVVCSCCKNHCLNNVSTSTKGGLGRSDMYTWMGFGNVWQDNYLLC